MRLGRYADLIPLIAFLVLTGLVFLLDRERSDNARQSAQAVENRMERRANVIGDILGNHISARMGSLETAKGSVLTFQDSVADETLVGALDSITTRLQGVTSVSMVYPNGRILRTAGASFGRTFTLQDTALRNAYLRATTSRRPAATGAVGGDAGGGRRVFVFDPIPTPDSSAVLGVLVAELDPITIYRIATAELPDDSTSVEHIVELWGPDSVRFTTRQIGLNANWPQVQRAVRVADSQWYVRASYRPPDLRAVQAERVATWIAGLALALSVALILHFLRRTIRTQKDEIARRQAAEEAAREAAAEARERAREARDLAAQLEAAQGASQRLSTSLNPDDVVELFLGGVAEILNADVASLYTFEEEGEVLVGRKRMVFREIDGITDRFRHEDIAEVRAPVALLPSLGEAVSTGEPYVVENADEEGRLLTTRGTGPEAGVASITVPLLIAGHTVGVAQWEVYSGPRRFPPALVAFAQALAAPAAASLRTAELFLSLEDERQRAAREALRFGAVLDQMADGVVVVDRSGNVERSNEAAAELLDEALADAPVNEWARRYDLVSVEGRPLPPSEFPLARALRGERVRRTTFIVRSDWGTERHLSASAGPILSPAGEPTGAAIVMRDVTDEHQYAEMLRHTNRELRRQADVLEQVNQQLREATKAKDQFLAVMSHELRTPINAIMGYSDLLDLGVKGSLNDDQRAMLTRVRETSKHLLGLINEVLDLAKIGAGRMDLVLVELDAAEIVDRAAQQIMPMAAAKGLTLNVEPPGTGSFLVRADETRLMQILVNLMSNATKFTQHGGIVVRYGRTDGRIRMEIQDSGPGIPDDHLEQIFEEFYQVEGGLSRSSGGTGLGLAISRRFARLMGGEITVESEVGQGSKFIVDLPAAAESSEAPGESTACVLLLSSAEAAVRTTRALRGTLRVATAEEPAEIAALARREQPLLTVLDVLARDNAAWRALTALNTEAAAGTMPVVLLAAGVDTGSNGDDQPAEIGLVRLLSKPLAVERAADLVLGAANGVSPCSVIVADSDPDVRRILSEALTVEGCQVQMASSGGELLEMARRTPPSVIVMDLLIQGVDGLEVLAALRSEPALAGVPVVAATNHEFSADDTARLDATVARLARSHRVRRAPLAELIESAVAHEARGAA